MRNISQSILSVAIFFWLTACGASVQFYGTHTTPSLERQVIASLSEAQTSIDLAIYSLTSDAINEELVRAHERGIRIRVITDKTQAGGKYSKDEFLAERGIPLERDTGAGLMHNKLCIIDKRVILCGSYNFTKNANENNDECFVRVEDRMVALECSREFETLWDKNRAGLIQVGAK